MSIDIRQFKKYRHKRSVRATLLETGNWLVIDGDSHTTLTDVDFKAEFELAAQSPKSGEVDGRPVIFYD